MSYEEPAIAVYEDHRDNPEKDAMTKPINAAPASAKTARIVGSELFSTCSKVRRSSRLADSRACRAVSRISAQRHAGRPGFPCRPKSVRTRR